MNSSPLSDDKQLKLHIPKNFTPVLMSCLVLLVLCVIASLVLGARHVGWNELIDGLFHPEVDSYGANVVRKRISRTVFSLMCGGALGVSGALMQAVTRNPIADPSILGVNTGHPCLWFAELHS